MMKIVFEKISGSGNDFIIVDNRSGQFDDMDKSALSAHLCRRRISIGADGMIFIENSQSADIRMNYFNSDGSSAAMCGNGARCIAFAATKLGLPSEIKIETGAGIISAKTNSDWVKVEMPSAKLLRRNVELVIDDLPMLFDYYDTGVPHAVAVVEDIESVPVKFWGREIRYHRFFAPEGANADFVEIVDEHKIKIRTYERGVENETLACGTGTVAAALSAYRKKLALPPIKVITKLPDEITIDWNAKTDDAIQKPTLAGKIVYSFSGEVEMYKNNF